MKSVSVLIVDDTVLGAAISRCIATCADTVLDRKTLSVRVAPAPCSQGGQSGIFFSELRHFLDDANDGARLLFINLDSGMSLVEECDDLPGLEIADEMRLMGNSQGFILAYSFATLSSLVQKERSSKFIGCSSNSYFRLPTRFKDHFNDWVEEAKRLKSAALDIEAVQRDIFAQRAQQVSKRYLIDLRHSLVDKDLDLLKQDVNRIRTQWFQEWVVGKILSLFSKDLSELCGIDMMGRFGKERRGIVAAINRLRRSSHGNSIVHEIQKIEGWLRDIIAESLNPTGQWNTVIDRYKERLELIKDIDALREIFHEVWDENLFVLSEPKHMAIWRRLKASAGIYYQTRLKIENTMWKLSIWMCEKEKNRNIDRCFRWFLDPLMNQIEQDDCASIAAIFDATMLQKMGLGADSKLSTLLAPAER